jgi:UDP:flavonoid glycosyltransferase YjiC (YdhE family)
VLDACARFPDFKVVISTGAN